MKWHDGGTHGNKQNVFDDFQACAEFLADNKYTRADRLIIQVRHNMPHTVVHSPVAARCVTEVKRSAC